MRGSTSYIRVDSVNGCIRTTGGNRKAIRTLAQYYVYMSYEEFRKEHPTRTKEDYETLKVTFVEKWRKKREEILLYRPTPEFGELRDTLSEVIFDKYAQYLPAEDSLCSTYSEIVSEPQGQRLRVGKLFYGTESEKDLEGKSFLVDLLWDRECMTVDWIIVPETARNRGIFSELVRVISEWFKQQPGNPMMCGLDISPQYNSLIKVTTYQFMKNGIEFKEESPAPDQIQLDLDKADFFKTGSECAGTLPEFTFRVLGDKDSQSLFDKYSVVYGKEKDEEWERLFNVVQVMFDAEGTEVVGVFDKGRLVGSAVIHMVNSLRKEFVKSPRALVVDICILNEDETATHYLKHQANLYCEEQGACSVDFVG